MNRVNLLYIPLHLGAMIKPIYTIFGNQIKMILNTRHIKASLSSFVKIRKDNEMGKKDLEDTKNWWYTSISLPYTEKYNIIQKSININKMSLVELTAFGYGG